MKKFWYNVPKTSTLMKNNKAMRNKEEAQDRTRQVMRNNEEPCRTIRINDEEQAKNNEVIDDDLPNRLTRITKRVD